MGTEQNLLDKTAPDISSPDKTLPDISLLLNKTGHNFNRYIFIINFNIKQFVSDLLSTLINYTHFTCLIDFIILLYFHIITNYYTYKSSEVSSDFSI
jgi:hypothetical protein